MARKGQRTCRAVIYSLPGTKKPGMEIIAWLPKSARNIRKARYDELRGFYEKHSPDLTITRVRRRILISRELPPCSVSIARVEMSRLGEHIHRFLDLEFCLN